VTRLLLGEVRQIVGQLRDSRRVDLPAALRTLGAALDQPRVEVQLDEDLVVDPLRAHALYRCAQEALTNAVRHARATAHVTPGAGLRGMRERVEEAGGDARDRDSPEGRLPPPRDPAGAGEDRVIGVVLVDDQTLLKACALTRAASC
jgi:signal transduction histidine kinase